MALNHLWGCGLDQSTLIALGRQLGADVPIFIQGEACFADGIGDIFHPAQPDTPWYLIVCPDVVVNTAAMFAHPDLPRSTPKMTQDALRYGIGENDFQSLVLKNHPEVAKAFDWLLQYAPTKMTGSGACFLRHLPRKQKHSPYKNIAPLDYKRL